MFDHLIGEEPEVEPAPKLRAAFTPADRASPENLLNAQVLTSQWLSELGAPDDDEITDHQQQEAAREAFALLATPHAEHEQTGALLRLKSPQAIQKLNVMLSAYDWEFVHRAKELRSYAVGKILEETNSPDGRLRLRALELLGKVTEVGLFTERVEIKKVEVGDTELEERIKEKLQRFMMKTGQLEDATVKGDLDEIRTDESAGA